MKRVQSLSPSEAEVMSVLWNYDKPLKVQEVCDNLTDNKWAYKTVATLLLRMEEKGAVKSEKIGRTNYYSPVLNKEEYKEEQTKSLVSRLYNGSVKELAVSLFKSKDMTKEDIEDIKKMFDL
ncbi:MAG: BlaI/MecI/CopY family transcriptional regulator [Clostridia bacterium]|nr:BlaI/MecI/CopY family transcriptional regulator [Clostridia bacterium]